MVDGWTVAEQSLEGALHPHHQNTDSQAGGDVTMTDTRQIEARTNSKNRS